MSTIDLEAEYNNRNRVPEHTAIAARWADASERWRKEADIAADQSYGSGARQRYDLFRVRGKADAPLAVYIHGGYWQRGDRKDVSFIARPFVEAGVSVAMPSYSLAPSVSVGAIVEELRTFLKVLNERTGKRPVVIGHSAGGHLAAAMLATDWRRVSGAPADLVRAAVAVSGVFDPRPLVSTSINEALKLDAKSAAALDLVTGPPAPKGSRLIAVVGGDESQEFIRQSLAITRAWSAAGVKAECLVVPGANHFTILDELARPDGALATRIVELAQSAG